MIYEDKENLTPFVSEDVPAGGDDAGEKKAEEEKEAGTEEPKTEEV
jgi:hypothetical protein